MDYFTRYGPEFNPFIKNSKEILVDTSEHKETLFRLNYLAKTKGFGLLTGSPGRGKTTTIRNRATSLNPALYKVVYSSFIGTEFTGKACYFGDPVSLDEDENTITFWHCGMAACTLAREDTGAEVGVHPNRKIGPTMEFGCKPYQNTTIFRFGRKPDGTFRLFIARGEVLDKPKQFCGTSIVVKTENYCKNIIINAVKEGWEPHFAVAYGKIAEELEILGNMLDMEICKY